MKKFISIILVISIYFVFAACGKTDKPTEETTTATTEPITTETTLIEKTGDELLMMVDVALLSIDKHEFSKMHFSDYIQSTVEPTDVGTAMTLLIYSPNNDISLLNIESVTVKSSEGTAVNVSTDVFMLNNKKGCVVFAKTEGDHKPTDYSILIKTMDGATKLIPVPEKVNYDIINSYLTDPGQAKYGDLMRIKNIDYFIFQSGSFSSVVYSVEEKKYAEVILGTVLIPIKNTYQAKLNDGDFSSVFFDINNYGNYNVKTFTTVNDVDMIKNYKDNYKGLFAEVITCTFTVQVDDAFDTEQSIAKRDYVMDNTWIKATFDENFLYKLYSK